MNIIIKDQGYDDCMTQILQYCYYRMIILSLRPDIVTMLTMLAKVEST